MQSPASALNASLTDVRSDNLISTPLPGSELYQEDINQPILLPSVVTDNVTYLTDAPKILAAEDVNFHDPILGASSNSWFLGADLDVDALDFTLSSALSEWAQLPMPSSPLEQSDPIRESTGTRLDSTPHVDSVAPDTFNDSMKTGWFTCLSSPEDEHTCRKVVACGNNKIQADENYRASLSLELQHKLHDEALPSSQQLNLFAKLFFDRFLPLFPVIHAPTFCLTPDNTLLFLSICSVGSLFVNSAYAAMQGTRIFERLNKAILASWEIILCRSRTKALSMVQAAILGQTFAILSGRSRDLVLADVLHGAVMTWARESNKRNLYSQDNYRHSSVDSTSPDIVEQWHLWVAKEQHDRVEIALNIHDAELSSLLHHDPIRKHRLNQVPQLATDNLFMAPTAKEWAVLYRQASSDISHNIHRETYVQDASKNSRFYAYGILESIGTLLVEARQADSLTDDQSQHISNLLMQWWRKYSPLLRNEGDDPFGLPILWHSIYMSMYADMNLLEQAIGRDGEAQALAVVTMVRNWASSLEASKCLAHALLIQHSFEQMRVSSEPAIHVPRALFWAALAWLCFTRFGTRKSIDLEAFESQEIQNVESRVAVREAQRQPGSNSFGDINPLHRLTDLLQGVGRWAISRNFATILRKALSRDEQ